MSTLLAVGDIAASKRFYHDILGMNVISDFGANVTLTGGISLQTLETWEEFIGGKSVVLRNNAAELYFEETDINAFLKRLDSGMTDGQVAERMDVPLEYVRGFPD